MREIETPATRNLPPVPVSEAMVRTGVATWETTADLPIEERVTRVYQAMEDQIEMIPVYGSRPIV